MSNKSSKDWKLYNSKISLAQFILISLYIFLILCRPHRSGFCWLSTYLQKAAEGQTWCKKLNRDSPRWRNYVWCGYWGGASRTGSSSWPQRIQHPTSWPSIQWSPTWYLVSNFGAYSPGGCGSIRFDLPENAVCRLHGKVLVPFV